MYVALSWVSAKPLSNVLIKRKMPGNDQMMSCPSITTKSDQIASIGRFCPLSMQVIDKDSTPICHTLYVLIRNVNDLLH